MQFLTCPSLLFSCWIGDDKASNCVLPTFRGGDLYGCCSIATGHNSHRFCNKDVRLSTSHCPNLQFMPPAPLPNFEPETLQACFKTPRPWPSCTAAQIPAQTYGPSLCSTLALRPPCSCSTAPATAHTPCPTSQNRPEPSLIYPPASGLFSRRDSLRRHHLASSTLGPRPHQ
jgi:hypothetical protein